MSLKQTHHDLSTIMEIKLVKTLTIHLLLLCVPELIAVPFTRVFLLPSSFSSSFLTVKGISLCLSFPNSLCSSVDSYLALRPAFSCIKRGRLGRG